LAATRPSSRPLYRRWDSDEARSAVVANERTLFKYRLVWANGRDAGRAAYQADIRPGDTILTYRGQWLRVRARGWIDEPDSPYDGVLEVEPA
jgi:hypothetical protein